MKHSAGFTLVELLVTISLVAILTSVAVPSFKTTIQNGRLVSQGNDFLSALILARSQAIATNSRIMLCSANSGLTACANSANWESGWIIGTANSGGTDITGTPLRVHEALTGSNTLRNDASAKFLIFGAGNGIPTAGAAIYFRLCDSRGTTYARSIYLSPVGEGRISPTPGKQIDNSTSISSCP